MGNGRSRGGLGGLRRTRSLQSENRDFRSFSDAVLDGARDANGLAHDGSQDASHAFVKKCAVNRRKWESRDALVDFHAPLG